MKSIIIGQGEVGKALWNILVKFYPTELFDFNPPQFDDSPEIMHICFPFSGNFISDVKKYQQKYRPRYTIIHSTVTVGTSSKLKAIHSPVIGLHPFLEEGLKTFVKFLSGEKASEVADYFRKAGMKVYLFDKSETTELLKILDTTFYALNVEYIKEIKRLCGKYKVPFEAWTIYNENYNQGYQKLGYPEFTRPDLVPIMKKIGGHCLLPNCDLLNSSFAKFIKDLNK